MSQRTIKNSNVILDVEMIVPPNRETKLKIFEGDSVHVTVKTFCKMWGLNQATKEAITQQIMDHLVVNNLLASTKEGELQ